MMTIITEKPARTIDVVGYGIDNYTDKSGNKIWKVYGVVSPMQRGRLVSRDSEVIKDLYVDEETICIFRSMSEMEVRQCKHVMDVNTVHGVNFFSVEAFKELLGKTNKKKQDDIVIEDGVIVNED